MPSIVPGLGRPDRSHSPPPGSPVRRLPCSRRNKLDVGVAFHASRPDSLRLRLPARRVLFRERANGDCVLYDPKKGCTVYPVRPAQCRTWPFWQSNVESPEAWERTVKECPGSGNGELIPVEEILKRVRAVKM